MRGGAGEPPGASRTQFLGQILESYSHPYWASYIHLFTSVFFSVNRDIIIHLEKFLQRLSEGIH